jgi:hypothetical protein
MAKTENPKQGKGKERGRRMDEHSPRKKRRKRLILQRIIASEARVGDLFPFGQFQRFLSLAIGVDILSI